MSSYYALLGGEQLTIANPQSVLERLSVNPPVDRLHYRDGNHHSTPSYRNSIPIGPNCIEITKEAANAIFQHWKDVWFDEHRELYAQRDEALARDDVIYYAVLGSGTCPYDKLDPDQILRRVKISSIHTMDEALHPDGIWYPTEFFRLYNLGHNDDDYEELSISEAHALIPRWPQNVFARRNKSS